MSDKESSFNSISIFNGQDRDKWYVFQARVVAYAREKGWDSALTEDQTAGTSEEQSPGPTANEKAWSALLRLTDGKALDEVLKADKNAHKAWKKLEDKYQPKDNKELNRLSKKKVACQLRNYANPGEWIEELIRINKLIGETTNGTEMESMVLNSHILANLPKEYLPI